MPTRRILMTADVGELDGIALRLLDDGKGDMEKVNVPVATEEVVVYSAGKRFAVHGYESLRPYLVGYLIGTPILENNLAGMRTDPAPNLDSLFRMLAAGRTDVAVESRFSLCAAKKLGLSTVFPLEPSLGELPAYHFIHKSHHDLAPKLEEALRQMQREGIIKRIQDETLRDYMKTCE
jgi:polar amino acid transport system substrate-binding protein